MSVLLEALKKAAENKQQGDEADQTHESVIKASALASKTTTNDRVVDSSDLSESPDSFTEKASYTGLQLLSEEEMQVEPSLAGVDELELNQQSPELTEATVDEAILIDEKENSSAKENFVENANSSDGVADVPSDTALEDIRPLIKTEKASSSNEINKPQKEFDEPFEDIANDQKPSPDVDSYSWTMDELPGYQARPDVKAESADKLKPSSDFEQQNNSILTSEKRFKVSAKKNLRSIVFGRSSNLVIYTLLVFLLLSFMTFFSVLYFQEQSFKLEQSMRKYEIATTPVVKVPLQGTESESNADTDNLQQVGASENIQIDDTGSNSALMDTEGLISKEEVSNTIKDSGLIETPPEVSPFSKVQSQKVSVEPKVAPQTLSLSVQSVPFQSELQVAYQALYAGDYHQAAKLFNKVLLEDRDNVKALTGLGAVYAHLNQESKAIDQYYQVLRVEPENLQAFEAIISLMGDNLSGPEWRKEIQRVLDKHPNSSILNYALGNLYAQERDWEKAQSYYFESYVMDEENPDSLVNLAVSLDHLGKYQLAEKYYTLALVYADSGSVNFKPDQVKHRLAKIKQFIAQEGL